MPRPALLFNLPRPRENVPKAVQNLPEITDRDRAILDSLVRRIRVLSVGQVARTWFEATRDPGRFATRRLRLLEQAGLIERYEELVRPELSFKTPLASWKPGRTEPAFSRLATQLASRWQQPVRRTPVLIATKAAGTKLGGHGGRRPRRSEVSHDLSLAGLFLHLLETEPDVAATWTSEAGLRRLGFGAKTKLPDALVHRESRPTVIELGGIYAASKLQEFHGFCQTHGLAYEIW